MLTPKCPALCTAFDPYGVRKPVAPDGKAGGLLVVGEAPGAEEMAAGMGFVGQAGKTLALLLEPHGIRREDYARTNAAWCKPEAGAPGPCQLHACRPNLEAAIRLVNPAVILAVGAVAAKALGAYDKKAHGGYLRHIERLTNVKGFGDYRLNVFGQQIPVIPMPHTSPLAWTRIEARMLARRCVTIAVDLLQRT